MEIFEISNGGFELLHLYSDDSSDDDIFERELDSKMDKLDQKLTLLKLIVEDLEFEFSNCLMDHSNSSRLKDIKAKYNGIIRNTDLSDFGYGNYNVGECSHGVEELDKDFINETNEENGEDSSEEEIIEEKEEQMFVKGMHEEKEEEILNQDSIEADSIAKKSTQDDIGNEYRKNDKKGISFDFKMFDIPKIDDKEKSAVGGFEDCLMKGLFRQDVEPDNSVRDIKPDIKDASIRVKPKRESSIGWYLKFPFKVRGGALNNYANTLSQTEVLTADTLFIMDEETDPIEIVYSSCTNNVKIPILFLESLAPGLKIDEPVIDAWADLLNFNERYKSANSPSRYFFKPIL
nr:hypothetical protein [Tanacetum cinerariifolium]